MADLAAILDGFRTVLEARIPGLRVYAGDPDKLFVPPGVVINPSNRRAASLDRSVQTLSFDLVVAVKAGAVRTAKAELWGYLSDSGDRSVEAALLDEPALDGSVSDILDVRIEQNQAWGKVTYGGLDYPSGVLTVEVICG